MNPLARMKSIYRQLPLLLLLFLIPAGLLAQKAYPTDYFRSPVDFRILLSGTFGELRANHFHSGMDIKTHGTTGAKVYAVADGYVSRIKMSGYGYGKSIYITHPNGYVSVYGHLSRFNRTIGTYTKKEQYRLESYEIDVFPEKDALPVKKGDVIAYSGNSGSTAGPHLHFELRDAANQEPLNPLLFGFDVKDFFTPKLSYLKIYPADEAARVNGDTKAIRYSLEGWGKTYRLAGSNKLIKVRGNISFGVSTYDLLNDSKSKNGVYTIELLVDSVPEFLCRLDKFSFAESRYINSLIDYPEYIKNHIRIERTEIDPGNKLSIYHDVKNKGVVFFNDTLTHEVTFIVKDVKGNTSILNFPVKADYAVPLSKVTVSTLGVEPDMFLYNGQNHFEQEDVIFDAPAGAFYNSFHFEYSKSAKPRNCLSAVHHIHNEYTPIQNYCNLSIKPDTIPKGLESKMMLVMIDDKGMRQYAGGELDKNGFVSGRIREFGDYSVSLDTVPPTITPVSPQYFKNLKGRSEIKFIIKDNLSGIGNYKASLNGKWLLFEYDPKNNLLTYFIDDHLKAGSNPFSLEVTDNKGNKSVYNTKMIF